MLQFLVLGFKEIRSRFLQRSPYTREVLKLHDGGRIALDWVLPAGVEREPAEGDDRPLCMLLHGAIQDSSSVTMADLARSLADRGMPVCVMNRRGYGGIPLGEVQGAKMSMFGFDEDLDDAVQAAVRRCPGRPFAVIGFSCGSGFAGRYAGARAHLSAWGLAAAPGVNRPRLLCTVAYDPGYDVSPDGAVARIRPPYSWAVNWAVKYCYAFRHREILRAKSSSTCDLVGRLMSPKHDLTSTYKEARRLSGAGDSSAWLDMQQPRLDDINVPSLMINSRDDPICVWENVEAFKDDIAANPNLALAELCRGSHGCKFGFWGWSSVVDSMIGEFVSAAWQEWRSPHAAGTEA